MAKLWLKKCRGVAGNQWRKKWRRKYLASLADMAKWRRNGSAAK
jgi:hypothetical protein